jgi:probable rRNA maturation factor
MRELTIHCRHPQLKVGRRDLKRAIDQLDRDFRFTVADWATLSPAGLGRAEAQEAARRKGDPASAPPSAAPVGELSVSFLSDAAMAKLHGDFLDDPTATDVITFEGDTEFGQAGDICVSVDTALRYARRHRVPFAEELMRYVIHGWLHLVGFDDLEPQKKRRMRAAEARALKQLNLTTEAPPFILNSAQDGPAALR